MSSAYLDLISVLSSYSPSLRMATMKKVVSELRKRLLSLFSATGTNTEVENDSTAKKKERG